MIASLYIHKHAKATLETESGVECAIIWKRVHKCSEKNDAYCIAHKRESKIKLTAI